MRYIEMPDLSEDRLVDFYTTINGKSYHFIVKWNEYCNCAILDIYDNKGNEVKTGTALNCNTVIGGDKREMPFLVFKHKDNSTIEPTPETFKDYWIFYENTTE